MAAAERKLQSTVVTGGPTFVGLSLFMGYGLGEGYRELGGHLPNHGGELVGRDLIPHPTPHISPFSQGLEADYAVKAALLPEPVIIWTAYD